MSLPPLPSSRRLSVVAGLAILLAACGSPSASPSFSPIPPAGSPGASPTPSTSPSPGEGGTPSLLIEVTSEGGFISPLATLSAPPQVVVDDDGRIYTPATTDGATTPLVAPITVRDVGADGAVRILEAIRAAGLDRESSGGGIAADTGSIVFTVVVDGQTFVSRFTRGARGPGVPGVPAGIGGPDASDGPGASGDPGSAAFDLLAKLTDPMDTWGAAPSQAGDYTPIGYRVFAAPEPSGDTSGATEAWPLATGLADFGTPAVPDFGTAGLRSGLVTGAQAEALAPVLAAATADTTFTSAGVAYRLWVQPLFPDAVAG